MGTGGQMEIGVGNMVNRDMTYFLKWMGDRFTVPHPDTFWYRLNGMGTQKNEPKNFFLNIFSPRIFPCKVNWRRLPVSIKHTRTSSKKTIFPKTPGYGGISLEMGGGGYYTLCQLCYPVSP